MFVGFVPSGIYCFSLYTKICIVLWNGLERRTEEDRSDQTPSIIMSLQLYRFRMYLFDPVRTSERRYRLFERIRGFIHF